MLEMSVNELDTEFYDQTDGSKVAQIRGHGVEVEFCPTQSIWSWIVEWDEGREPAAGLESSEMIAKQSALCGQGNRQTLQR